MAIFSVILGGIVGALAFKLGLVWFDLSVTTAVWLYLASGIFVCAALFVARFTLQRPALALAGHSGGASGMTGQSATDHAAPAATKPGGERAYRKGDVTPQPQPLVRTFQSPGTGKND